MSFALDRSTLEELMLSVFRNYRAAAEDPTEADQGRPKTIFDAIGLPEKPVIQEITDQPSFDEYDLATYLTFSAVVNYQKETAGPTGLWSTTYRLLQYEPWLFEPKTVEERGAEAVHGVFQSEPLMNLQDPEVYYDTPDVAIWVKNARALSRDYEADVRELLRAHEFDAPSLQASIQESRAFPFLGGEKINPLWLRLMHEEILELRRIEEISLPVDTNTRSITRALSEESFEDDDDIRDFWDDICADTDLVPVRLDQPLWLLGKYWDSVGRPYIANKVEYLS